MYLIVCKAWVHLWKLVQWYVKQSVRQRWWKRCSILSPVPPLYRPRQCQCVKGGEHAAPFLVRFLYSANPVTSPPSCSVCMAALCNIWVEAAQPINLCILDPVFPMIPGIWNQSHTGEQEIIQVNYRLILIKWNISLSFHKFTFLHCVCNTQQETWPCRETRCSTLIQNYRYLQTKFQQITLILSLSQLAPNQVQTRCSCNYHESCYIKRFSMIGLS